jgi:RNA polymerase sigma-70 factor (ECF subfamily)
VNDSEVPYISNRDEFEKIFKENFENKNFQRILLSHALILCSGNKMQAEDLLQDSFERAWKNMDRFDGENFVAWTKTIMKNRFVDLLRKKSPILPGDDLPESSIDGDQEFHLLERDAERCLRSLTGEQRMVINFRKTGDDYASISKIMDLSKENVRKKMCEAKKSFIQCMELERI